MNTETKLREALAGQANTIEIGALASVDELAGAAGRRDRRNRVVAGAGALMLAFFVALGVNNLTSTEETGLIVADDIEDIASQLSGQWLRPSTIVPGPAGNFAGLTAVELSLDGDTAEGSFVTVVSEDGLTWNVAAGSPAWRFAEAKMVEKDGDFHIVGLRDDQLTAATSNDLVDWSEQVTELSSADFVLFEVVVGDMLGAVVIEEPGADQHRTETEKRLIAEGVHPTDVCEVVEVDDETTYRLCGAETPAGELSEQPATAVNSQIYVGLLGEALVFEEDQSKAIDSIYGPVVPWQPRQLGVEITDAENMRVEVLLEGLYPSMDLEEFRVAPPAGGVLPEPVAGRNGDWALVVHRWDRLRPVQSGPVRIANEQFELAGQYPFGPASLTGAEGELLRSWDHFEFANLGWSGVEVAGDGLRIRGSSEATAFFTHEEWADGLVLDRPRAASDVVYSPDGSTWAIVATLDSLAQVAAVGDEAVLVASAGPGDVYESTNPAVVVDVPIDVPQTLGDAITGTVLGAAAEFEEALERGGGAASPVEAVSEEVATNSSSSGYNPVENEYGELVRVDFLPSGLPTAAEVPELPAVSEPLAGSGAAAQLTQRGFEPERGSTVEHVASFGPSGENETDPLVEFYLVSDEGAGECPVIARRAEHEWQALESGCSASGSDYRLYVSRKLWSEFDDGLILSRAPSNAAWFVIERFDGSVVKAPFVDGFSAAVWPREEGRPLQYSVQDEAGVEIYAEVLDWW